MNTLLGILAAFGTAAAKSVTDVSTKAALREMSAQALMAVTWCLAAAFLVALLLLRYPALVVHPAATFASLIKPGFWTFLAWGGLLNAIAAFFYTRAFKFSDASLVAPMMLLTPVFMLVTSPLMLGESVPLGGVAGIGFAVAGAWLLGKNGGAPHGSDGEEGGGGFLAPFRILMRDRGVRSMLVTVTIWSVSANLDKMGVLASTPLTWGASLSTVVAAYSIALWAISRRSTPKGARIGWSAVVAGCAVAAQSVMQNTALTLLLAPYVIAIKRTSAVMTVLASGTLLSEPTANRLAGALVMMAGTLLIVLAG